MKAMIIQRFGDASVFEEAEVNKPRIKADQVLVDVLASSVNPIDVKIRRGDIPALAPGFPAILHGDVSGVVSEVGAAVSRFKVGDEVYGCAGGVCAHPGVLADFVACDEQVLALKPKKLDHAQAASVPLVGITAWQGLKDRVPTLHGKQVLVHGGCGGVGHIGVQLAKVFGAQVTATCSTADKALLARQLGADHTVIYKEERVQDYVASITGNRGFDVVFDTVGGQNIENSFKAAALSGHVVTTAARCTLDLSLLHQKALSLHAVFMLIPLIHGEGLHQYGEILTELSRMIDQNKIKLLLDDEVFRFKEVKDAHRRWESGQATGKIVLVR